MAYYNLTNGGSSVSSSSSTYKSFTRSVTFDATKFPLLQNDSVKLISVPADTFVRLVRWQILTVEGGARNFALGDATTNWGWFTSTLANALTEGTSGPMAATVNAPSASAFEPILIVGYSGGKYFPAADSIDLIAITAGGLTGLTIKVTAVMDVLDQ